MPDIKPFLILTAADSRRRRILDAAESVFVRLGYRKTSMEEVARAAQVSRQGLYLHFATKEDLFRETVRDHLGRSLLAVETAMADRSLPLDERLAAAFDAWYGRAVGARGAEVEELLATTRVLLNDLVETHSNRFREILRRAAEGEATVVEGCRARGVSPGEWSRCLLAAAIGLKLAASDREEFRRGLTTAIRLMWPAGAA